MNSKWEYEVIPLPPTPLGLDGTVKQLNTKGNESWELVSIFIHPESTKFHSEAKSPLCAVFKRQKAG